MFLRYPDGVVGVRGDVGLRYLGRIETFATVQRAPVLEKKIRSSKTQTKVLISILDILIDLRWAAELYNTPCSLSSRSERRRQPFILSRVRVEHHFHRRELLAPLCSNIKHSHTILISNKMVLPPVVSSPSHTETSADISA